MLLIQTSGSQRLQFTQNSRMSWLCLWTTMKNWFLCHYSNWKQYYWQNMSYYCLNKIANSDQTIITRLQWRSTSVQLTEHQCSVGA
jgi:hypothetical protein